MKSSSSGLHATLKVQDTARLPRDFLDSTVVVVSIWLYALMYPPFIMGQLVDLKIPGLRLITEFMCLLVLSIMTGGRFTLKKWIWIIATMSLVSVSFFFDRNSPLGSYLAAFNKIIFALLLMWFIETRPIGRHLLAMTWTLFGVVASCSAIIAISAYMLGVDPLIDMTRDSGFEWIGNYQYLNYGPFGNIILRTVEKANAFLPRYTGWQVEPGVLSFIFALNIAHLLKNGRQNGRENTVIGLNLIAGALTFSGSFFVALLLICAIQFVRWLDKRTTRPLLIVIALCTSVIIAVLIHYQTLSGSAQTWLYASLTDRVQRIRGALSVYRSFGLRKILFGGGIGVIQSGTGMGAAAGIVNLIVEWGLIFSALVCLLSGYAVRRAPAIVLVLVVYSLAFTFFLWPLYWLGIGSASIGLLSRENLK